MNRASDVRASRRKAPAIALLAGITALIAAGLLIVPLGSSLAAPAQHASGKAFANVTVAYPSKIQLLDPDITVDFPGTGALHLIGGNLFELVDGHKMPGLAISSHTSADGLTQTFILRKGLRFSNGMPLTSADVKATLDRARHDKANANGSIVLPITGITTPNATTVVITMNRRYASFSTLLGGPPLPIFPAKLINTKHFFDHPISAGPYVLASWGGTNTATFTPNKYYWGAKPAVQKITFETVPDANSALAQVESGQVDIAYNLPPALLSQVRSPAKGVVTTMYGGEVMTMRGAAAPFNQQGLRVAVSDALNRGQMSKVIYGGKLKPLKGYWPSSMPGYDPSISTAQDITGAKAALKGTTCAKGCTVSLKYCSAAYPEQGPEALIIKSNLAQIGINVTLVDMDPSSYFNVFAKYNFQLLLYPLYDYQNVPDGYMGFSLLSAGGQQAAYTGLKFPDIEATAHQIEVTSGAARTKALLKLNQLFVKHAPFASLTDEALIWATRVPTSEIHVSSNTFFDVARTP